MIIVDFDGTLLRGNSFPMFIRFLFSRTLRQCRYGKFISLCRYSLLRKSRAISHKRFKWLVMGLADDVLAEDDYEAFATQLTYVVNQRVMGYIDGRKDTALVSAASREYVDPFARMMGIHTVVATTRPVSGGYKDYNECRGEEKIKRIDLLFGQNQIDEVLTDHYDDLPLLKAAKVRRILIAPTPKTLAAVNKANLDFEVWE